MLIVLVGHCRRLQYTILTDMSLRTHTYTNSLTHTSRDLILTALEHDSNLKKQQKKTTVSVAEYGNPFPPLNKKKKKKRLLRLTILTFISHNCVIQTHNCELKSHNSEI